MAKGEPVHVHAPDDIAMARKVTLGVLARPVPPMNSLAALACRTLTRRSPFGAGEAHDGSSCALLLQVSFIFAVFPLTHALMVMAPRSLGANAMGIPNEDHPDALLSEKLGNVMGGFVALVADLPFGTCPQPSFGVLQFAIAPRASAAARLLSLELSQALVGAALPA